MPPAKGDSGAKDGFIAKAAGVAVLTGIGWSLYKSVLSKPNRGSGQEYEIAKGDTLFGISQKYGVSVESLRAANGIPGDDIYAGDRIVIPK